MTDWLLPTPLFNPITASSNALLNGWEILAGPFGLLAFLPLVPLLRLIATRYPCTALITAGLVWIVATSGPATLLVVLAGLVVSSSWVLGLARLRRADVLSARLMVALVWIGLVALLSPLWWVSQSGWYGWTASRMAPLHNVGFAYFLLRFIAWGVQLSKNPSDALRPVETVCWLLYPPCMRLGPVLLRDTFLDRLAQWKPRAAVPWKAVAQRLGLFILGGIALGVVMRNTPQVVPGAADFFSDPSSYSTISLLRLFYFVPLQIYLLLWTYNELAAALGLWVGIKVDNNFDWLPRATSVRDFWRRWHVTLGVWLRDYIYIPLGGNRGIIVLNYAAVFAFCAIWHGPSFSFLLWGASQTGILWLQREWDRLRRRGGWENRPSGRAWSVCCWALTMHYQLLTILIFADFEHMGMRILPELFRRLTQFGA